MIKLKNLVKTYNGKDIIVDNLDLEINRGEIVMLVGESGCGKTTTMRMINKLEEVTSGSIFIDGKDIQGINPIQLRRNIGYVIQKVGLFPHLTVGENIGIIPKLTKNDPEEIAQKTIELLNMVDLNPEEYLNRYPNELSGGQQQRVGVARALANDPDIILMDEPFSALDPLTREQLQNELLKLQDELQKTIVFVTHDIEEAIKVGDKIAVMQHGKIMQYDTPENILKNPANDFIENFVGQDRLWKTPDMLRARDVMNKNYVRIGMNRSIAHAVERMREKNTEVMIVTTRNKEKQHHLEGAIGMRQLKRKHDGDARMKDIMQTDVLTVDSDMPLNEVLQLREKHNPRFIPVLEDGFMVGVITEPSILHVLTEIIPESEGFNC